jgi:hypothetical protein
MPLLGKGGSLWLGVTEPGILMDIEKLLEDVARFDKQRELPLGYEILGKDKEKFLNPFREDEFL